MILLSPALFFSLVAVMIGGYVLLSLRHDGWRKWVGPGLLGVVLIGSLLVLTQTLGRPIPQWAALSLKGDVVAVMYEEDVAIYLWVKPSGAAPVAVMLPWKLEEAKETRKKIKEGEPLEFDSEMETPIHPKPVQPLPPKEDDNGL